MFSSADTSCTSFGGLGRIQQDSLSACLRVETRLCHLRLPIFRNCGLCWLTWTPSSQPTKRQEEDEHSMRRVAMISSIGSTLRYKAEAERHGYWSRDKSVSVNPP